MVTRPFVRRPIARSHRDTFVAMLAVLAQVMPVSAPIADAACCGGAPVASAPVTSQTYRLDFQTVYDERQVEAVRVSYETVYDTKTYTVTKPV